MTSVDGVRRAALTVVVAGDAAEAGAAGRCQHGLSHPDIIEWRNIDEHSDSPPCPGLVSVTWDSQSVPIVAGSTKTMSASPDRAQQHGDRLGDRAAVTDLNIRQYWRCGRGLAAIVSSANKTVGPA
jgi:hypothetical protein